MAECDIIGACFVTAREVVLPPTALPAAGAFVAAPDAALLKGVSQVDLWIQYDQGAAGGFPAIRVEWLNGTEVARDLVLDQNSLVISQPNGTVNVYQLDILGPA